MPLVRIGCSGCHCGSEDYISHGKCWSICQVPPLDVDPSCMQMCVPLVERSFSE
jgi:hypothetical protein